MAFLWRPCRFRIFKGMTYISAILDELGYALLPGKEDIKSDIVTAIRFEDAEKMKSFCRGVQKYSHWTPTFIWKLGICRAIAIKVIMASGGFVEGSSIN